MQVPEAEIPDIAIHDTRAEPGMDGYVPITLLTDRGVVECRWYAAIATRGAVLCVGGIGGGWDTPAQDLYPRLCLDLAYAGIAGLRVRFRNPTSLAEATADVLAGIAFLGTRGIERIALVGHSFGGPIVIQAALRCDLVRTIVTLATGIEKTETVDRLAPNCSILLIQGTADDPPDLHNSEIVYARAREPKRLVLLDGADHGLDQAAGEVLRLVRDWIVDALRTPAD